MMIMIPVKGRMGNDNILIFEIVVVGPALLFLPVVLSASRSRDLTSHITWLGYISKGNGVECMLFLCAFALSTLTWKKALLPPHEKPVKNEQRKLSQFLQVL